MRFREGSRSGRVREHFRRGAALFLSLFLSPCLLLFLTGCFRDNTAGIGNVPEGESFVIALPEGWPALKWPKDNPYSAAKKTLGRDLFFEFEMSRDRTISCGWCHTPLSAFTDNHHRPFSSGVANDSTRRNSPTLANLAFARVFMFDGGATTLEAQALLPLFAHNEMDMTGPEVESRLAADTHYVRLFREAYGPGPVTMDRVTKALATYQRTLISYRSPYDRWSAGETAALSPEAARGAALFLGNKTDCRLCHVPPLFTDGAFHNTGLDSVTVDRGRGKVTGLAEDEGRFKTPTLRNVATTGPYMHDGRFETLADVLRHYNAGGKAHPGVDTLMRPLGLTAQEISDLAAFLEALTDNDFLVSPWL